MANHLSDSGKNVIIVLQVPTLISHVSRHLSKNINSLSESISSRKVSEWKTSYAGIGEVFKLLGPEVKVLDPTELFCDNVFCFAFRDGVSLYFDDNHMSVAGGELIAGVLAKEYLEFP